MKPRPFALERYFAAHEFSVKYLLSASDPESLALQELLDLADDESRALWQELRLGYTDSQGHPLLRAEIARLYARLAAQDILVAAPEEAIFLAMNALLRPGDHVVVAYPAYQSLYALGEDIGCAVTRWPLRPQGAGWMLDVGELAQSLRAETRLIVVNFPHNPTGFLPERAQLDAILELAARRGLYVFCDEMYRLLEYDPAHRLAPACDLYERAISLSGLSKSFALPGLRLGWLATPDRDVLAACASLKDYTTICQSAPSEVLAIIALRAREAILARNLDIIAANLALADGFFAGQRRSFAWRRPQAGSIALPELLRGGPASAFCRGLLERKDVLLLPGAVFEYDDSYFRLGLGRRNFPEALARLAEYVEEMG